MASKIEKYRMRRRLKAAEPRVEFRTGILRLRDCFAKRSSHSAQDDNL